MAVWIVGYVRDKPLWKKVKMLSSLKKLLFNLHACHSGIFLKKYRICLSRFPHHTSFPFLLANLFMLFYIIFAIYFSVPQRPLSHHQLVRGFSHFALARLLVVCSWLWMWYAIFTLFLLLLHFLICVLFDFYKEGECACEREYVLHVSARL